MKRFKWFFILSLASALLMACGDPETRGPVTAKEVATYKIAKQCSKTLSERYGLTQCHKTEHLMYEIKDIFLAFHIDRNLTKEEVRAMVIDCAQEVIAAVNEDSELQRYLPFWGFGRRNVRIQIIQDPDPQNQLQNDLRVYTYKSNKLLYETFDPNDRTKYKTSESETYQNALALLNSKDLART